MEGWDWQALLIGFLEAFALFIGLFLVVGAEPILKSLVSANPTFVVTTLVCAFLWLGAWRLVLRTVLASLEIPLSSDLSSFDYASADFTNNVTPFGQAGGEPIAALLISQVANARYETSLASIATVDMLNVVSSLSLILIGVSYYTTTAVVGERLQITLGTALALVAILGTLMSFVWRYQDSITDELLKRIAEIVAWCPIGTSDSRIIAASLSRRIHGFFDRFEQIATQRRHLAIAFSLSLLG